ncbi:unnamed protein product [Hymenolepis diminuta]|uniref:Uncharacterized protein n=1 Tax=Hymenolepis diminuta TaxID=6216 RepID=A0A564YFR2_HYMDI|nr:unnamed protein product [Hymenolepis diminuta]
MSSTFGRRHRRQLIFTTQHKNPTSFHFVQWKCDSRQTISTQATGFFDDVTLRTVITPYLSFELREPGNPDHLSTEETHSRSDNYQTNIRSSHFQEADSVENVVIIETGLSKTSLPELQRKWS